MKTKVLIVGIMLALALLACQPRFFGYEGTEGQDVEMPGDDGNTGEVKLILSNVSPYLIDALGIQPRSSYPASKAYLMVSKVDLELYKDGAPYAETTEVLDLTPGGWEGAEIEWPMVPAGDNYHVVVYVYNDNVDPDNPILYGASELFSVVAGETTDTVWIYPTPIDPISVPPPPGDVSEDLDSCWDTGETETMVIDPGPDEVWYTADDITIETPVYGWAEERWFEIDAASYDAIWIDVGVSSGCGTYFMVVDEWGETLTQALSGSMGEMGPAYWDYGGTGYTGVLTPDSTYYVGLVTISEYPAGSVSSTVTVSFDSFADDPYEENDTLLTAYTVTKATPYEDCVDLDRVDWDTWPEEGGDWYKFFLSPDDDPNVTVAIVFDHDECDLTLELWEEIETDVYDRIAESQDSEHSGQGTTDLEEELISSEGEDGIGPLTQNQWYYIWVYSGSSPVGASYALQWIAGTGTISIGIQ